MLNKIKSFLFYKNYFGSIEYNSSIQAENFKILVLKKSKSEFSISYKNILSDYSSFKSQNLGTKYFYLTINDSNVLSKNIDSEFDIQKALKKAFPNIKSAEFFFQIIQFTSGTNVTICRKNHVKKLLNELKQIGINIVKVSLGNYSAKYLIPYYESNSIETNNAQLKISNEIENISIKKINNESFYKINGLTVSNKFINPLGSNISLFTSDFENTNCNYSSFNKKLLKNFWYERLSNITLAYGLSMLMISLIINFLYYSIYSEKIKNSYTIKNDSIFMNSKIQILNSAVQHQKAALYNVKNSSNSRSSLFLDKIASTIPNSIVLQSLYYQPIQKKITKDEKINFKLNNISFEGFTSSKVDFSNWVEKLENMEWVKSLVIIDYKEKHNGKTLFKIELHLYETKT